ncbi:TPA_exp: hypothetical protein A8136_3669 [Trichophyton benhamiae CBS 112371]|nr:TPA_exp: hypothetical protein A8136_3669 [Trichophyton benhamiae CBS 112371]
MENITEIEGDLFLAPEGAALIHACNCQGSWGKGIALEFKNRYPAAYQIYRSYCLDLLANPQTGLHPTNDTKTGNDTNNAIQRVTKLPEGTALVIPPQPGDYDPQGFHISAARGGGRGRGRGRGRGGGRGNARTHNSFPQPAGKRHWIICLFTAWHYAAGKRNPPNEIIENTATALADLKRQIDGGMADKDSTLRDAGLWSCRINAGLFGVDWERSKSIMAESRLNIKVVSPPLE